MDNIDVDEIFSKIH